MKKIQFKFRLDGKFKDFPFTNITIKTFNDEVDFKIHFTYNGFKAITL